jgi:hypothetical protein
MKSRTEYVRPLNVKGMRWQVTTYKEFKKLVELWIDFSLEHSHPRMKMMDRDKSKKV